MQIYDVVSDVVWHKHVPLKVLICAWRLLRNRWPTKDNLMCCDVISIDSQLFVSGCGDNESANHLLIHCPTFGSLWQYERLGLVCTLWIPNTFSIILHNLLILRVVLNHGVLFCNLSGFVVFGWFGMKGTTSSSLIKLNRVEKVKFCSLDWLKAISVCFPFDYHMWGQQPLTCLGIG